MQNAMIIDPKDNVAVAIEPIAAGDTVTYLKEGKTVSLKATEDITIYHKLATRTIEKGEPVVKYRCGHGTDPRGRSCSCSQC